MTIPPDKKPGRNEPCWCGSGRKYKRCHLREDMEAARVAQETAAQPAQDATPPHILRSSGAGRAVKPPKEPKLTPEQAAARAEDARFEAADLAEKVAIFLQRAGEKRAGLGQGDRIQHQRVTLFEPDQNQGLAAAALTTLPVPV